MSHILYLSIAFICHSDVFKISLFVGFSQQILINAVNSDECHVNHLRNNFKWFTALVSLFLCHSVFFLSVVINFLLSLQSVPLYLSVLILCPFLVWDYQWLMNQSDHTTSAVRISLCCPLLYEWSSPSFTVLAPYVDHQDSTIILINQIIVLHTLNTFPHSEWLTCYMSIKTIILVATLYMLQW